jgi:hypothetical protein
MSLPTRDDFGGGLDAASAWEDFGGKSLEEAYEHFCAVPESRQEDFMWMGERAFRFYYPVIDRYLCSLDPLSEDDWSRPAWILATCIQMHFDCHEDMSGLHESILSLCDYVAAHLDHYSLNSSEQAEIAGAWSDLRAQVADDARGVRRPLR